MSVDYSQRPQPPKKGLGPLVWIAIGCGVILVVAGLVVVGGAGYVFHRVSKHVDIKDGKVKLTGDKGETVTVDSSGAQAGGGLKVTNEKGETATFGGGVPKDLPSWLPVYPGATAQGSMASTTNEGHAGGFSLTTKDSLEQVANFYESKLKDAGLTVEKNLISSNDKTSGGTIAGTSADKKRNASVILSTADNGTSAVITYEEKK